MADTAVSLVPLHTRPDLIDTSAEVIRTFWPACKTERLRRIVAEEGSGLPCSLVLIEHLENSPEQVIGYSRLVPVTRPESPLGAYIEGITVIASKQGQGFGRKLMTETEEYGEQNCGCEQFFLFCYAHKKSFYEHLSYEEIPANSFDTIGANLHRTVDRISSWYGNQPPAGWESAYDWGHIASKEEMAEGAFGFITMRKCLKLP